MGIKTLIATLILALSLPAMAARHAGHGKHVLPPPGKEGMPLPWPFPWAKECPIDWTVLDGTYLLSESADATYLDFVITPVGKNGFRLVRIGRYANDGLLLQEGFVLVSKNQKTIQVTMYPQRPKLSKLQALIRFHYLDDRMTCDNAQLVPILTLQSPVDETESQYRLVKMKK